MKAISHVILRLIKYTDKFYEDNEYATCLFVFQSWNETCFPNSTRVDTASTWELELGFELLPYF